MSTLTIIPLGDKSSITLTAYNAVIAAAHTQSLIFQTLNHPSITWLLPFCDCYSSLDSLYDNADDFDALNSLIADALLCGKDICYAVAGRGIGKEQLSILLERAKNTDTAVELLPSSGYAESAAAVAHFSLCGAQIISANAIPENIDVYMPLAIEEIDTKIRASEVKLALLEYYPEEHSILYCATDASGSYSIKQIPIFELDRQENYFASTVILVPQCEFLKLERHGLEGVVGITRILRSKDGCPWDRKQTHETLKTPLIEEAYEVMDAINQNDTDSLVEELGDLLLQIVFHAQIESERSCFTMRDVCTGIVKKLIYRHPHVFANAVGINTSDDVLVAWEELKKAEKQQKTQADTINAIPKCFPSLIRSLKVQKKAADVGFDWDTAQAAAEKIHEETNELISAMNGDGESLFSELGDLLFSVVNVARLLKLDPEIALSEACDKFASRFVLMEELAGADGKMLVNMTLSEMDEYWEKAKTALAQ